MAVAAGAVCRCAGRGPGHVGYLGRKEAVRCAESHKRAVRDGLVRCEKCAKGSIPWVFRCVAADHLRHWGHSWSR